MRERPSATLTTFIRPTDSGAATFLGLADDGNQYWVKSHNNPQGCRSLIPERIVTHIGEAIGAPVRPIALITIPEGFSNYSFKPGYRLTPGLAHGSLDLGPSKVVDDWRGLAERDGNRERAAYLAALWDLCEGVDPQWLTEFNSDASIWSFDHGLWFAGEIDWGPQLTGTPWEHPSIDTASRESLLHAAKAVENLSLEKIREITQEVPPSWGTTDSEMQELADTIFSKIPGVAARLRIAADRSTHP